MSNEPLYSIRDIYGAIYGPANVATLRQWIGEGRITPLMEIAPQGTQGFVPAQQMPELADVFAAMRPAATPAAPQQPYGQAAPQGAAYPESYGQSGYQNYNYVTQRSSGMAIASLVCSLCSFVVCLLPAILGVIFGHIAKGQIRREPERFEGDGLATAGLVIGYIMIGLQLIAIVVYILFIVAMVSSAPRPTYRTSPRSAPIFHHIAPLPQ